jgi:phosphatidylserine/phosphatidylglycerophosphate/cardiolipin synthase-like enzyme
MQPVLARLDSTLGRGIDAGVRRHHRRRLERLGARPALEALPGQWARSGSPPRAGNAVELLVDGANALPAIESAIASAQSHVHLAGWFFSPHFQLEQRGRTLRELLAETAQRADVRVLAWGGSPLPLFRPDRADVRDALARLAGGTRIHTAADCRERPMHCHHEKLVIVDDRVAFVGGIDLTYLAGDRFDRDDHPARGALGWHDACARLEGPAAADVAAHFAMRWRAVAGEALPSPEPAGEAGQTDVQVVRTVPERLYPDLRRGEFTILEAYLGALRSARQYVYLESQFLWSPEIVAVLADKLERPPSDDFRLVVVLPSRPNNGADDTRGQLTLLADADDGRRRLLACCLYQAGTSPPHPVYVHAKIGIVDDRWLTIGSANLNEHSLFNDTEMNVVLADEGSTRALRERLWAEHLECDPAELDEATVAEIVDGRWWPRAEEQRARIGRGEAPEHRLALLPGVSRRSRALLGPIGGLLVDG